MKTLTLIWAWLIGYYYERCPICGRGVAYMHNGQIRTWCNHD